MDFKVEDGNKNKELMSFCIDDEKLLEKSIKPFGLKLKTWKILNWMRYWSMMIDRYIKTKMRMYGYKVYTNFCDLNVPEDGVKCESFTIISIDSLFMKTNIIYKYI